MNYQINPDSLMKLLAGEAIEISDGVHPTVTAIFLNMDAKKWLKERLKEETNRETMTCRYEDAEAHCAHCAQRIGTAIPPSSCGKVSKEEMPGKEAGYWEQKGIFDGTGIFSEPCHICKTYGSGHCIHSPDPDELEEPKKDFYTKEEIDRMLTDCEVYTKQEVDEFLKNIGDQRREDIGEIGRLRVKDVFSQKKLWLAIRDAITETYGR